MSCHPQTYLWVLNRNKDFERALQLGAAGIMTDRPTMLADFLNSRNLIENDNVHLTSSCNKDS